MVLYLKLNIIYKTRRRMINYNNIKHKNNINFKFACGTASFGNLYKSIDKTEVSKILEVVWKLGYRYFDTAPFYGFGLSEKRVGDFLREKKSEEYILSTKVGRILHPDASYHKDRDFYIDALPFRPEYDYSYDGIMKSFEHSLQRLGLEKIDILYMHDLGKVTHGLNHKKHMKIAMNSGYKALEELKTAKLIKGFGLGVNEYEVCEEALDYGEWDYFLLAGRYTLLEQESIKTFIPKCIKCKSKIILGGVYNSGILATGAKEGAKYNYEPAPKEVLEKVKKIERICLDFDVKLSQAALQFPLLQDSIESILIGSSNLKHYELPLANIKVEIPNEFWQELIKNKLILEECIQF
jgi:D-threo-aldose 1-dehydrogenase